MNHMTFSLIVAGFADESGHRRPRGKHDFQA
jgi:hypothetical protein